MNRETPYISIIIAARPEQVVIPSLEASKRLDYPRDRLEIILARGKQPAIQRNEAVKISRGDLIYFLDDDAVPQPGNLLRAALHFSEESMAVVGGPNLCPPDAPTLEQWFATTMGCKLAFSSSAARYRRIGSARSSSEKELILCNLMFRKSAFTSSGGFDESLYPNEENALMDAILGQGLKLYYDPEFYVLRRPRSSLKAFVKMLLNYGRGRAEQFRLHPTLNSLPNLVPPFFVIYLLIVFFLPGAATWPLVAYAVAVTIQTLLATPLSRPHWFFPVSALIFATHIFYGLGFWKGLFRKITRSSPAKAEVTLQKIEL